MKTFGLKNGWLAAVILLMGLSGSACDIVPEKSEVPAVRELEVHLDELTTTAEMRAIVSDLSTPRMLDCAGSAQSPDAAVAEQVAMSAVRVTVRRGAKEHTLAFKPRGWRSFTALVSESGFGRVRSLAEQQLVTERVLEPELDAAVSVLFGQPYRPAADENSPETTAIAAAGGRGMGLLSASAPAENALVLLIEGNTPSARVFSDSLHSAVCQTGAVPPIFVQHAQQVDPCDPAKCDAEPDQVSRFQCAQAQRDRCDAARVCEEMVQDELLLCELSAPLLQKLAARCASGRACPRTNVVEAVHGDEKLFHDLARDHESVILFFDRGKAELDPEEADRLATFLAADRSAAIRQCEARLGASYAVFGRASSDGDQYANDELSFQRAARVRDTIKSLGYREPWTVGFGELSLPLTPMDLPATANFAPYRRLQASKLNRSVVVLRHYCPPAAAPPSAGAAQPASLVMPLAQATATAGGGQR